MAGRTVSKLWGLVIPLFSSLPAPPARKNIIVHLLLLQLDDFRQRTLTLDFLSLALAVCAFTICGAGRGSRGVSATQQPPVQDGTGSGAGPGAGAEAADK